MNAIYDAAHKVIATERDDGSFECQPTPQGKLVAKWLRVGVPALRGEVSEAGLCTEVPQVIAPSDVMFKLALIEMCERHGWNVHEIVLPPNTCISVTKVTVAKDGSSDGAIKVEALILPTLDSQCCPP